MRDGKGGDGESRGRKGVGGGGVDVLWSCQVSAVHLFYINLIPAVN